MEIGLVMTDHTLIGGDPAAAEMPGYGPVPGPVARDIIHRATNTDGGGANAGAGDPDSGDAAADALARYLVYRDRHCTTPFCEAPIRHLDHITAYAAGGPPRLRTGTASASGATTSNRCPAGRSR